MAELKSLDDAIKSGVEKALNKPILEGKSVLEWAKIGMDLDRVKVVRCRDCKHRPIKKEPYDSGFDLVFPDGICPLQVDDEWYSRMPDDDWYCADGERK